MRKPVNLSEYIQWRDRTKGGLTTKQVTYSLVDARTSTLLSSEIILITPPMLNLVTSGLYSSVVLAALDSAQAREAFKSCVPSATSVDGDVVTYKPKLPVFQVVAIDEEAAEGCTVFVEGVI